MGDDQRGPPSELLYNCRSTFFRTSCCRTRVFSYDCNQMTQPEPTAARTTAELELTGRKGMNCPTNKNAGTAMSGCGREVNTHQRAWGQTKFAPLRSSVEALFKAWRARRRRGGCT